MKLPVPVQDGWSLLTGCDRRGVVELLAALFLEGDLLESIDQGDFAKFRAECVRLLPRDESALVASTSLLEVTQEAVRQLKDGRDRDLAVVLDEKLWQVAAVEGSEQPVVQPAAAVLAQRRERLHVLVARRAQTDALDDRVDVEHEALMREPPGGRDAHPAFWREDRGRDGKRGTRPRHEPQLDEAARTDGKFAPKHT